MVEDAPLFDKQRRNVMVAGTLYLALRFSQISLVRFLPGQLQAPVSPDSVWRLRLVWAIAILYFMWRMFQVSHDVRATRRNLWKSATTTAVGRRLFSSPEIRDLRKQIVARHSDDGQSDAVVHFNRDQVQVTENAKDITYKVLATVTWRVSENATSSSLNKAYEVTIERGGLTWTRAALDAYATLIIKTTYFTDYTLAYAIGYAAAGLAIYDAAT